MGIRDPDFTLGLDDRGRYHRRADNQPEEGIVEADVMLPTDATRVWVRELWRAAGSSPEEAELVADHLVGANLAGHDSHGVGMVLPYVRSLKAGELQLNQRVTVAT